MSRSSFAATMRLFLAVELPSPLLDDLERTIAHWRGTHPDIAWVHPEKRHLTLKFLGDVELARTPDVVNAIDAIACRHRALEMMVGGVGGFPSLRRARVLWIGVEQEPRLELLHHDVEVGCEALGFEVEGRAFRPHITLARVRTPLDLEEGRRLTRTAKRIDFSASVPVEEITLFESMMGPGGSQYRRVHVARLTGGR